MGHAIRVSFEGAEDRTIEIERELVVGRSKDCGLSIADQRLSRQHARFYVEGGRLCVQDLGGPNGTTVNQRSLKGSTPLAAGDVVGLGKTKITVVAGDATRAKRFVRRTAEETHAPSLVKPVSDVLAPVLGTMRAEDYFRSLGLGEDTLHELRTDTLDVILRRTRDFAVLHEVSKAVQRETDPEQMLQRVLALLLEVTKADRGYAALLDARGELEVAASRSTTADAGVLSHTVAEHVLERRLAIICLDASADERFRDAASLMLSATRSLMAVPIVVQARVLGLIQLESTHLGRPFDERDLDLLSVVACTAGVAIDNLRLLDAQARTIRELEAAQEKLLATQERLVRTEQLAAIGRLAAGLAHEVKNHLSPFALASMIAKKHPEDLQLQEVTEMMHEAQQHILDLVNQVRAFASGAESSRERTPQDLAEVVEGVLKFLRYDPAVKRVPVTFTKHAEPIVRLDPRSFRQVLINLVRNAADAVSPDGGHIDVVVSAEPGLARVEVRDDGRGIPEELAERIFEPFFSTKGDHGLGLGLDISRKIVTDHGGRLFFTSKPGEGTTFVIELTAYEDDETVP
ncbi:ATP-binding protein [Myxococcota bacterium]|nr:ATP-binding protein [Myxococcota bacterium]